MTIRRVAFGTVPSKIANSIVVRNAVVMAALLALLRLADKGFKH